MQCLPTANTYRIYIPFLEWHIFSFLVCFTPPHNFLYRTVRITPFGKELTKKYTEYAKSNTCIYEHVPMYSVYGIIVPCIYVIL